MSKKDKKSVAKNINGSDPDGKSTSRPASSTVNQHFDLRSSQSRQIKDDE